MAGRPISSVCCAGLALMLLSACSSSGGGSVSDSTTKRVTAGFADIARDNAYSVDFSIARQDSGEEERTLSCLSVESDPRHPDGNHLDITNWGASTALDAQGGCLGGGSGPRDISVQGDYVLTVSGPGPKAHPSCTATYRRNKISPSVRSELKKFTRSQSPQVDALLKLATRSSGDGTSSVVLHLDPKKAAAAAGSTASTTPDSETLTITFADAKSHTIEAVEVDSAADDQHAFFRYKYFKLSTQQGAPVCRRTASPARSAPSPISTNSSQRSGSEHATSEAEARQAARFGRQHHGRRTCVEAIHVPRRWAL